jgi:hypothetical protein
MMRYYSAEHGRFINFEATGDMVDGNPVLNGLDCMGNEYEAVGVENTSRTLVAAKGIKVKDGEK